MSPLPKHSMLPSPGHTSPYYNTTSPCTAEDAITASVESFIFTILWLLLTLLGFTIEYICLCDVVNSKGAKVALKTLAFFGAAATAVTEIHLQRGKFWCAHGQGSPSTILDGSGKITDKG
ncbi:hypothetical protein EJ03DRAFT_355035 [Teratosphaeria nubilosa]|uniref:Uncharacterized protein n=1 Tax=Teratosphaeria nubilosa TaxID=161662 RepID=A0A6G1KX75_9PEZI|nr:hypothetical protein EJ03DRAFT_355035 [Teratosphaeria nubilosa]